MVTICLPNTPEAAITFFAVNKIGAIANMIHPLSAEEEIKNYLNATNSVLLVAFNQTYSKIRNIIKEIIKNNPDSVNDYKNGHDRAIKFLMGQVMKETKGKANPKLANEILVDELK